MIVDSLGSLQKLYYYLLFKSKHLSKSVADYRENVI